jgi:hypothetical protein
VGVFLLNKGERDKFCSIDLLGVGWVCDDGFVVCDVEVNVSYCEEFSPATKMDRRILAAAAGKKASCDQEGSMGVREVVFGIHGVGNEKA